MDNEFRIFGPPGTGKTTTLQAWIERDAQKHGSEAILVASFTKTAAAEIAGRHLPLERHQVGTLHSHCYRAIGKPEVVAKHMEEWNTYAPAWALGASTKRNLDEPETDQTYDTPAEAIYSQYQVLRAQMIPRPRWPAQVQSFAEQWDMWKRYCGYVDFSDMIEIAYHDVDNVGYSIGYYDEAQDFTKLELALIRKWGQSMDHYVLAGDDDQTIFSFVGATPDAFLDPPLPATQKKILNQSHRVPRLIQQYAQSWIERVTRREPKLYKPRDAEGAIRHLAFDFNHADEIIGDVQESMRDGKSVMILTACSYMLANVQTMLRERGIPFHNPYRRSRGDWNPLTASHGTSATDRILSFLRPSNDLWGHEADAWTGTDLINWSGLLKSDDVFKRGAKVEILKLDPVKPVGMDWLTRWMTEEAFDHAFDLDLPWFADHLLASKKAGFQFPYTIATLRSAKLLKETPLVTIGTIHSVKGGQADCVYLFPDISRAAMAEWANDGVSRDAIIRQFYVGISRARETLVICQQSSRFAVPLPNPTFALAA